MNMSELGGVMRAVLAAGVAFAAGKGWIVPENAEAITAALATVAVAVWSVIIKRKAA